MIVDLSPEISALVDCMVKTNRAYEGVDPATAQKRCVQALIGFGNRWLDQQYANPTSLESRLKTAGTAYMEDQDALRSR